MISKKIITALAQERIDEIDNGVFIVDISVSPANQIRVELDRKEGGISIEECVRVSRNIEHNLDREEQDFELQVSSAGLDKPLRVPQQYEKNIGRQVRVILNHGSVEGELLAYQEDSILVKTETKEKIEGRKKKELVTKEHLLDFDNIKEVKLVISFGK